MSERNFLLVGGCFLLAGLMGCGARSSSMVSPGRATKPIHGEGSARREPKANGESSTPEGQQRETAPTMVIGFVGGFVRHTDAVHSPVQVAERLRKEYPSGVHVEVFENRHRYDAYRRILELLDAEHAGKPSDAEKRDAKIVIYGMSWGGSEAVALARELKDDKIPVLLTVQVDSVAKVGQNDEVIPANVAEAANFYQTDGLLHGRAQIRAEESAQTKILGNFHYEYKTKSPSCDEYPWYDRLFTKYHTKIECDPEVWNRVESLIRAKLQPVEENAAKKGPDSRH